MAPPRWPSRPTHVLLLLLLYPSHALTDDRRRVVVPIPRPTGEHASGWLSAPLGAVSDLSDRALSALTIRSGLRGRDQRWFWVRAVAYVHPVWRLAALLALLAVALTLVLQPDWRSEECRPVRLATLWLCQADLTAQGQVRR